LGAPCADIPVLFPLPTFLPFFVIRSVHSSFQSKMIIFLSSIFLIQKIRIFRMLPHTLVSSHAPSVALVLSLLSLSLGETPIFLHKIMMIFYRGEVFTPPFLDNFVCPPLNLPVAGELEITITYKCHAPLSRMYEVLLPDSSLDGPSLTPFNPTMFSSSKRVPTYIGVPALKLLISCFSQNGFFAPPKISLFLGIHQV